jgi:hypothetical protein
LLKSTNYEAPYYVFFSILYQYGMKGKNYKIVILPVVLYGYETWSLTPMEGHRLRVFENRVLRRIFEPNGEEVAGG